MYFKKLYKKVNWTYKSHIKNLPLISYKSIYTAL